MVLWTALNFLIFELLLLKMPKEGMAEIPARQICSTALTTQLRFDGLIQFLENWKLNSSINVKTASCL